MTEKIVSQNDSQNNSQIRTTQNKASSAQPIVIIAAAGAGKRLGAKIPKQYLKINDSTILDLCLDQFVSYPTINQIILVVSADDEFYPKLSAINNEKVQVVIGGKNRVDSVANALNYLTKQDVSAETPTLVHDGARPCITHSDIEKLCSHYSKTGRACLLAAPVVDTLQKINNIGEVIEAIDREKLMRAFTPQMASLAQLNHAFSQLDLSNENTQQHSHMTDEISVLSAAGYKVDVINGRSDNIKVTYKDDLTLAEFYLKRQGRI